MGSPATDTQGRWLVWADQDEFNRLQQLRAFSRSRADQPFPEEMTRPKLKQEEGRASWSRFSVAIPHGGRETGT